MPPTALIGTDGLTLADVAPMIRAEYDVVDKAYRKYELGQEVGRFLRAIRVDGAATNTIQSYEHTLRLLTLDHADLSLADFEVGGTDLLYDFLAKWWGDAAQATLDQRKATVKSFFNWAEDTDRIGRNPARRLKTIKKTTRATRRAHELAKIKQIAAAQESVRDEAALLLMGRLALRKMEAGSLQARDIDLAHDIVYLKDTKSGQPVEVPIVYEDVRVAVSLWLAGDATSSFERHPDEYLLAPRGKPRKKPNAATVHRWFKRCLEKAGAEDFPMHELRHSAGDYLHRQTRDTSAAQKLLRHSSLKVTEGYLHPTQEDLRARMREADK